MFTNTVVFRINGLMVANEQFQSKTQAGLDRASGHWRVQTEFTIRATLKVAGIQRATIDIVDGGVTVQHPWIPGDGIYGIMQEGKIL